MPWFITRSNIQALITSVIFFSSLSLLLYLLVLLVFSLLLLHFLVQAWGITEYINQPNIFRIGKKNANVFCYSYRGGKKHVIRLPFHSLKIGILSQDCSCNADREAIDTFVHVSATSRKIVRPDSARSVVAKTGVESGGGNAVSVAHTRLV